MWVHSVDRLLAENIARNSNSRRHNCSVYRIPPFIRNLRPQCYDYNVIPLGLYNRDFRNVTPMVQLELEVVAIFFKHLNLQPDVDGWNTFCRDLGMSPRDGTTLENFYHELPSDSSITPNMGLSVLVIDAVFIAAICVRALVGPRYADNPPGFVSDILEIFDRSSVGCYFLSFLSDVGMVFENQVPLYMLQNVWGKISHMIGRSFERCLQVTVGEIILNLLPIPTVMSYYDSFEFESCTHMLECVHRAVILDTSSTSAAVPSRSRVHYYTRYINKHMRRLMISPLLVVTRFLKSPVERDTNVAATRRLTPRTLPTVAELRKAGIRFRGVQTSLCGIRFEKSFFNFRATLNLPQLEFSDVTERLLLNLCAFELMRVPHQERRVTAFVSVMDELISTEEDVHLLREGPEPVISANLLRENKRVADLFDNILQNFVYSNLVLVDLDEVINDLHAWNDARWRHQVTHFIDRFVTAPWIFVTMVAATLLLSVTIGQTVYTVLGFYHS
ncbi:hypothetical protein R1flu_024891 [Riccia fluitans]|uniref:Uncharacterized protein n=1 Tax=Riccia fluitans TaxID=41844 RepID=A0ABD1XWN7_9MARC